MFAGLLARQFGRGGKQLVREITGLSRTTIDRRLRDCDVSQPGELDRIRSPSWADGRAIPFDIYDIGFNEGFVDVGISRETSAFVIKAIRSWWLAVGRHRYRGAKRLLIECDCGGRNGPRIWAWKVGLQQLADEFGLTITVGHFPPGASKWNLIEHRMFSLISANWAAEPLTSYEVVLKYIRATSTTTGLRCRAKLDESCYPKYAIITMTKKTPFR